MEKENTQLQEETYLKASGTLGKGRERENCSREIRYFSGAGTMTKH